MKKTRVRKIPKNTFKIHFTTRGQSHLLHFPNGSILLLPGHCSIIHEFGPYEPGWLMSDTGKWGLDVEFITKKNLSTPKKAYKKTAVNTLKN